MINPHLKVQITWEHRFSHLVETLRQGWAKYSYCDKAPVLFLWF